MPLHFAASRTGNDAILARMFERKGPSRAANDNGRPIGDLMADPQVLRSTLLHFARHGLAAADVARNEAVAAFAANDEQNGRHWLAICRQLDRRMARRLESQVAQLQA
ncbi:hypothetical protein [Novosphingobium sp. TH158]|uniref:hypothetical protein n=1 Tax=Novosphingobium sp. TH158 TaxID=2067455 RepID=UPI000C7B8AEF|nr:hypothetical protein [Novosphingobium sp. TH158]PLK24363.1 hypothetical protein C0V78_13980 [Novosphingobium sp. TH158]